MIEAMAESKPPRPSARRRSILVYPIAKDRFDEVHRELRSDGATQTLIRLLDTYREHNQKVTV